MTLSTSRTAGTENAQDLRLSGYDRVDPLRPSNRYRASCICARSVDRVHQQHTDGDRRDLHLSCRRSTLECRSFGPRPLGAGGFRLGKYRRWSGLSIRPQNRLRRWHHPDPPKRECMRRGEICDLLLIARGAEEPLFRSSCPEAFYSDKRLELQLERQAARAIEDEALLRRPAAQTTALYGFTSENGCVR